MQLPLLFTVFIHNLDKVSERRRAMGKRMNLWSFILSISCILLFFIASFAGPFDYFIMGMHPLNLIIYMTWITFVLGVFGFSGIQDLKGLMRSITTLIINLGLSTFLIVIIFFGSLLS